jgi:ABC-2 type transport system ATP-binding protein
MGIIDLDRLTVQLATRTVLSDLTGQLQGRAIGLLGPNGAGKSTLINTLLGFHRPVRGAARVFGLDCHRDSAQIRGGIGYMPENDSFIANMPAITYVRMAAELSGLPEDAALERAHEVLFYVGLGEARYRKLGAYSLGMKQMAKLAQAIVHGPKLVILDEPTNGLDPQARLRMIKLICEMKALGEMSILICSHLLRDIEETCEEAVILKAGEIVHYSNLEEERASNRRFVEIETEGDDGSFADAVERLGCACAVTAPGKIKTVLTEGIEIRDLYRLAADRDVQLRRLNYRRDSLEDIFMKAMEK